MATNSIVDSGSSISVLTVIKNTSTNDIQLIEESPVIDFDLSLTNSAGELHRLTPVLPSRVVTIEISRDRERVMEIPVKFGKSIQPGDYTLIARRNFTSSRGSFRLESNPLKVRIK